MSESISDKFLDPPKFQSLMIACLDSLQQGQTIDRAALAEYFREYAVEIDQFHCDRQLLEYDEHSAKELSISRRRLQSVQQVSSPRNYLTNFSYPSGHL